MAKASADIRSLARAHTDTAIRVLAGIMREKKAPAAARVTAAEALLSRGWGKPPQTMSGENGEGVAEVVARIVWGSQPEKP